MSRYRLRLKDESSRRRLWAVADLADVPAPNGVRHANNLYSLFE